MCGILFGTGNGQKCVYDESGTALVRYKIWLYFSFSVSSGTWIGINDEEQESVFRWLNGAPLYYDKWSSTEPNGKRTENCVAIYPDKMHDLRCSTSLSQTLCSTTGKQTRKVYDRQKHQI